MTLASAIQKFRSSKVKRFSGMLELENRNNRSLEIFAILNLLDSQILLRPEESIYFSPYLFVHLFGNACYTFLLEINSIPLIPFIPFVSAEMLFGVSHDSGS